MQSVVDRQTEAPSQTGQVSLAPGWPYFDSDEVEAVNRVLRSGRVNYWTGDEGRQFEREFAAACNCRYGVAVANGTVALELALRILGIRGGDQVLTTSRTFVASASCVVAAGAQPICTDVDRDSQNMTVETLRRAYTPQTRAIVAVHLAGWPCDMDAILEFAADRNLYVIEDCAQAHGARYKNRPVGSMGHVGAFSFCQDKIMTTGGEGGMIVTNREDLFERAWAVKDHGKSYRAVHHRNFSPGFRWLHESFGTNWRMTEMQSAIGRVQLRKLPDWVVQRRSNAAILAGCFRRLAVLRFPEPSGDFYHSYYKCYAFVRPERLRKGWTRDRIQQSISDRGVFCGSGSCSEIYLEQAFPPSLRPRTRHVIAAELGKTSLMFQVHPTLTEANMRKAVAVIEEVVSQAAL